MRVFRSHLQNAFESLSANRMRTFLTILGVLIGIASITIIMSLSGGITDLISGQITDQGGAITVVRPQEVGVNNRNIISSLATSRSFARSSITEQDYTSILEIENIDAVAPLASFVSEMRAGTDKITSNILATSPDIDKIINLKLHDGQFISGEGDVSTIVIGHGLAIELFNTSQVIGRNIYIKDQPFLVVGVLEEINNPINFNNIDFDFTVIMNLSAGKRLSQNSLQVQQINIKSNSVNSVEKVHQQVESAILKNHQDNHDFVVLSGKNISHPASEFLELITVVLTLVASVSLLVGGVGIMNIMLVNVSERTREIGIRKALGANNSQIIFQFLTESIIISLAGGFFGYIAGYSFSFGVSSFLPFQPLVSWEIAGLVGGVSLIVGIFFGVYPGIKAARKDPIESLRHYS